MFVKTYIFIKHVLNAISHISPKINKDWLIVIFLDYHFASLTKSYKNQPRIEIDKRYDRSISELPIFTTWWQGVEAAPVLVKKCIQSIREHAGSHPVYIITKDNFSAYIDIPEYILTKLTSGQISLTHFSDILRMALLSKYGGLWLDATIFVSALIPTHIFEQPFFTIHHGSENSRITKGRWTGYCMAGLPGNLVHSFGRDIFYLYWKKFSELIEYFLIDYVIDYAQTRIPEIRQLILQVPINNTGVKLLDSHFNDPYSSEAYQEIIKSSIFFKLNWKRAYALDFEGKPTMYSYFISNNVPL